MRILIATAILLLSAGCLPQGMTPAGTSAGAGVLVQSINGPCATAIMGIALERVCLPGTDPSTPPAADSIVPPDSIQNGEVEQRSILD
ncbi:MAG TPA: hypothetical protein VFI91_06425 [Longimicrobiaceae bacterium]|nr:hypothetical protein [Longimicrobiaceae bacterium]